MTSTPHLDRRGLLGCAALLGVAGPLLVGCSSEGDSTSADGAASPTDAGDAAQPGETLVAAGDVPVGGGVVLADQKVVVVQPSSDQFRAYSAVCTHQGCTVGEVKDGTINCPCHGSAFAVDDGAPVSGPASSPLAEIEVKVEGDQVVRA